MPTDDEKTPGTAAYPNMLRQVRERQKSWTREALKSICQDLHAENPSMFTTVGLTTLRTLEAGLARPQLKTAATLARALEMEPSELFPMGTDDPRRNPSGNTRIAEGRRPGGRPKKNSG